MKVYIGAISVSLLSIVADAFRHSGADDAGLHRRDVEADPLQPATPFAKSSARDPAKRCVVTASPTGHDDAPAILKAFQQCNKGGTVVLNANYTIASPLDLTFLDCVDVSISGSVKLSNDIDFWTKNSFKYAFQNASAAWRFGGRDVHISGSGAGVIDGNGQAWYDAFAKKPTIRRPVLFVLDGLEGGSVTGLKMRNPPFWFNLIANSSDILVSDLHLTVKSKSHHIAKNTDGWDTYRSRNVVIQNSTVQNGDDCVSFKPNSTDITVQNLSCDGSHGISVGSLGQYPGKVDIVENIYVYNTTMKNGTGGARIKVWPGSFTPFQPSLSGGGGSGHVRNVTFDTMSHVNNDWAVELTQCYGSKNLTLCHEYPSNVIISDITFKNMQGTTSKKNAPEVGTLTCSDSSRCENIRVENINVQPPSTKKPKWLCNNIGNTPPQVCQA